jgi:class 3 adenylate cyclase
MNAFLALWEKFFTTPKNISRRFFRAALLTSLFGLPAHIIFLIIFVVLGEREMSYVNVGSIVVWLIAVFLARSGRVLGGLLLISAEVAVHAIFAVHFIGWHSGFQQYLITLAVAAFIIPRGQKVSALISAASVIVYILLYVFYEQQVSGSAIINFFYIPNTIIALLICITTMAYYTRNLETTEIALGVAHEKSETLLNNIMPSVIADRLKDGSITIADGFNEASVLFADIEGFTVFSEAYTPAEVVKMLNGIFSNFDVLVQKHKLEKIKTIGDAYMVAAGIPVYREDHAEALAAFALDVRNAFDEYTRANNIQLRLRIGINSGPVIAGVIGRLRFLYDLWGDAVNTASRMESHGIPGEIQVTENTYEILKNKFNLDERGIIEVKGKGKMRTYLLRGEHIL